MQHVVNALEGRSDQFTPLWRWRHAGPGDHANELKEGEASGRNLAGLEMAERRDWVFEDRSSAEK
jgi:sarcosine oxidase / L-pipecolate oxidase